MRYHSFILAASLSVSVCAQNIHNVSLPAKPPSAALANVVKDNFLGISWELSFLDELWGQTPDALPNAMQNYLANIRARMNNDLRIRIGGNGMDSSTYVPDQTEFIVDTDPDAYFNDVPVDFGPVFFDVMNAMADKVGGMEIIIGLSMQTPGDYSNMQLLAEAAAEKLGSRLDAMLLGNEPDLYANHGKRTTYTISDYIPEITDAINQLEGAGVLHTTLIGGPTICCNWDLEDVINAGLDSLPYKYYTIQHYPTNVCNGVNAENTNISYFLSHTNIRDYVRWNQDGIIRAEQLSVPVLLTEYNSVSCGGTNISDTFAMSLWATDVALQAASSNISGAYLHTREFNVTYNLFDPPSSTEATESGWRTGSPYYTELLIAEALSSTGSVVVDLNLNNSLYDPSSHVAGYAVYDHNGTTQGKLVLINYADGTSQDFAVPANITHKVEVRMLLAPSVTERSAISWAGQTIGQNGDLEGEQTTDRTVCKEGCVVNVPGPGAAVVFLASNQSDKLYVGNSTIAGLTGYNSTSSPLNNSSSSALRVADALEVWTWLAVSFGVLALSLR